MGYLGSSAPKIGGMSQSGRRRNRQNRVNNVELFHVFRLLRTPPPSLLIDQMFLEHSRKIFAAELKMLSLVCTSWNIFWGCKLILRIHFRKEVQPWNWRKYIDLRIFLRKYIDLRIYLRKVDPRRGLHFVFIYQSEEEQRLCCLLKIHLRPTLSCRYWTQHLPHEISGEPE